MKKAIKVIAMLIFCALMFANILPASAETTESAVTTPSAVEDSTVSVTFENGEVYTQYIYTGEVITPKLIIKKTDGSTPSPDEYSIEYLTDSKSTGAHHLTVTYLKSGYKAMRRYDIVPGKTDKVDVKVKDGKVAVSWNPVPGAGVYRVYKYNEATGTYGEMWWSDGQIAAASTSRTFTSEELEPGKTYKMGIMALPSIEWMPTDEITYFTVEVPKDSTDNAAKPVTTEKATEKHTQKAEKTTLITPQPTKPGVTSEGVVSTTVKEEVATTAEEKTTLEENTTEEIKSTAETLTDVQADSDNVSEEKEPVVDRTKLIIIIVVCLLAIAGIIFSVYKKKK